MYVVLQRMYSSINYYQSMIPAMTSVVTQTVLYVPRFPPVFDEWFLHSFPDPTAWYVYKHSISIVTHIFSCYMYRYQARVAYIRTCAVMSIVGYIVGLGDRHGENILFDSTNGDCVHVDFNCLFNRVTRTQ